MSVDETKGTTLKHSNKKSNKKKNNIKSRKRVLYLSYVMMAAAVAAIVVTGVMFWHKYQVKEKDGTEQPSIGLVFDENAVPGGKKNTDNEIGKIRERLQHEAEQSEFRVQINTDITVKDNEANLMIVNADENPYDMAVTITSDDGTKYYDSGNLESGGQIMKAELNESLTKGIYPATATVQALNPSSSELMGEVKVNVTITVE